MTCETISGAGELLRSLVGEKVACAVRTEPLGAEALDPREAAFVAAASPRRMGDFVTGRMCAREALMGLGLSRSAIPMGRNREPVWPDGVVGSITHCSGFYAAAVARDTDLRSIGIDVERCADVDDSLDALILTPAERNLLDRCDQEAGKLLRASIFSIKESVFKCLFPVTRTMIEFLDVDVRLAHPAGAVTPWMADTAVDFTAFISVGVGIDAKLRQVRGRHSRCGGLVLSVAELQADVTGKRDLKRVA